MKGVRNYVVILAIVCTEFIVIGTIVDKIPDQVLAINGLFNVITDFKYLPVVTVLLLDPGNWNIYSREKCSENDKKKQILEDGSGCSGDCCALWCWKGII